MFNGRLTDNYNKTPESNLSKLLLMIQEQMEALPFTTIRVWRSVDTAEGKTLDLIGGNVNQIRGAANDSIYRSLIRSAVLRNNSSGTIPDLIRLISFILRIEPDAVELYEGYELPDALPARPGYLYLKNIPTQGLGDFGLTTAQLKQILNEAVAAGVNIEIEFLFNTWGAVNQYTWNQILPLTWAQVREVELAGIILP